MSTGILQQLSYSLAIALTTILNVPLTAENANPDGNDFQALFDGETLAGWRGDPNHWKVVDGAIIGTTKPAGRKTNTFLIADGDFKDFVLRLKFKLTNGASGIQFRSVPIGSPQDFLVTGYQADIGGGDTGTFYEEKGRGTLVPADQAVVKTVNRPNDWNTYTITMIGKTGEIKLNGQVTARYIESREQAPTSGVIALQLQAGSGMEIAFKDIKIHELKPARGN